MNANILTNRFLVSVITLSLLTLLFLRPPLESYPVDKAFASIHIILTSIAVACHFLINRTDKNLARYDVLFLLGMIIVNFQWAVMMILHDVDLNDVSKYFANGQLINFAVWLSSLAITSWILGYDLLCRSRQRALARQNSCGFTESRMYRLKEASRKSVAISLALFLLFVITVGSEFLSGVYLGTKNWAAGASYIYVFLHAFVILSTALIFTRFARTGRNSPIQFLVRLPTPYVLLVLLYVLMFLWLGDRGGPIEVLSIAGILYGTYIRPVPFRIIAPILLCTAVLVLIVGQGRNSGENIVNAGFERASIRSAYDLTVELANSEMTLLSAVKVVDSDGISLGKLMLSNLLSVVPFGQSMYLALTGEVESDISSSRFFTEYILGPAATSGTGTSYVAEIYLSFGVIGVVLLPFLHGVFFAKLFNRVLTMRSLLTVVLFAAFSSIALYAARDAYFGFVKICFWISVSFVSVVAIQTVAKRGSLSRR